MPSSVPASPRSRRPPHGVETSYTWLSTRPLHVLVFLAPLIVFYEIGSIVYLSHPQHGLIETIRAWRILSSFFQAFGVVGLYLPGIALIVVMLTWHIMVRDRWRVRPIVLATMAMESIVWTIPLLVFAILFHPATPAARTAGDLLTLPWPARLTISIGAGLYEELLFRMVLMAAIHSLVVTALKYAKGLKTSESLSAADRAGRIAAVVISAAVFALYHDVWATGWNLDAIRFLYFLIAGAFFGVIYLFRGFGIVVGVHACFDILVLVILPSR